MNINKILQYLKNVDSSKAKFVIELLIVVILGFSISSAIAVMFGIIVPLTIESIKEFQTDKGYEGEDVIAYLIGFVLGNVIII